MRKILSQGELDGACFLYSIANAAAILTEKSMRKKWKPFINTLPFKTDQFLNGDGTKSLNDNQHLFETIANEFFKTSKIDATCESKIIKTHKELREEITGTSIAIACINDGEHWLTICEVDSKYAYTACSSALIDSPSNYLEKPSEKLKRIYNRQISLANIKAYRDYYLIININQ